jgi:acetyl esterase
VVVMDPELQPFISMFPKAELDDPVVARRRLAELSAALPAPDAVGLQVGDRVVPGAHDVPVRVYQPSEPVGAVVWLRGGGFVMGDLDTEHPWATRLAHATNAVVVSVGYRCAPENPYPAALDDAYRALTWVAANASALGANSDCIAVGGHAAGANLAAAIALRARDEGGPRIAFQLLNQPPLDDRQHSWSARTFTDTVFMTRAKVAASWRHYLGATPASAYAAPARATDLSGLPPTYIATAEFDPNRDEALEFGMRLLQAGVSVELHQWPGTFHGSQAILAADVSQRQLSEISGALHRGLAAGSATARTVFA